MFSLFSSSNYFRTPVFTTVNETSSNILDKYHKEIVTIDSYPNDDVFYTKRISLYDKKPYTYDNCVAYIQYRRNCGQIGLLRVVKEKDFRRGLGRALLLYAIDDMSPRVTDIWTFTSYRHPFWSNVFGDLFVWKDPANPLITGSGYTMNLEKFKAEN